MADQAATDDLGGQLEVEAKPRGGLSGKKLVLFIVLPLILLLGGGAGVYFSGLLESGGEMTEEQVEEQAMHSPGVFFDLPEMLVNLNTAQRSAGFLKISLSLELESEADVNHIKKVMPRVVDSFQVYLRELRLDDLKGSAGLQRLREELLIRVNAVAKPAMVRDVLFKEMLVQ